MDKFKSRVQLINTSVCDSTRNARDKAISHVRESLINHTFFDKFVSYKDAYRFAICDFIPLEFYLNHDNVNLVKLEAKLYFNNLLLDITTAKELFLLKQSRENFIFDLNSKIKTAKLLQNEVLEMGNENLDALKQKELREIHTAFTTVENHKESKNL